jgi:CRISPR/Cas system-associated protein Cas7 (RAMP superfamily)
MTSRKFGCAENDECRMTNDEKKRVKSSLMALGT